MHCFEWISSRALPARYDLRARGWRLGGGGCRQDSCARLVDGTRGARSDSHCPTARRRSLVLDVSASEERAYWLARGFADVLTPDASLAELEARARRLGNHASAPAVIRRHARLALDLSVRDALVDGLRLRLNPREFALLWRLAESPGTAVPRPALLRDVLGLRIEPQTNALAVHVCRLRKKLHIARLSHLLVTAPGDGGYALVFDDGGPGAHLALDAVAQFGEEPEYLQEAAE